MCPSYQQPGGRAEEDWTTAIIIHGWPDKVGAGLCGHRSGGRVSRGTEPPAISHQLPKTGVSETEPALLSAAARGPIETSSERIALNCETDTEPRRLARPPSGAD